MAATRGCNGVVKSGATPDTVAQVSEWSFDETVPVFDASVMGSCAKTNVAGTVEVTGTVTCWWDPADTGQDNLVVATEVDLELFPDGDATGKTQYDVTALITGRSLSVSTGAVNTQSFTWTAQGGVTESVVAP